MAIGQVGSGPQNLPVVLTPLVLSTGSLDHGDLGRISVWAHPGESKGSTGPDGTSQAEGITEAYEWEAFSRFSKECGAQSGVPVGVRWYRKCLCP